MSRAISLRIATACALVSALGAGCTFGTAIIGGDASRVDRAAVRAEVARANAGGALSTGELLSFERRALRHRAG